MQYEEQNYEKLIENLETQYTSNQLKNNNFSPMKTLEINLPHRRLGRYC
jgi:hypothetical protein